MASVETTSLLKGNVQGAPVQGLSLGAMARDIATVGSGTALAAVFNVLLVFLIPRLVSVEDFGYWRLFLLYAGYVGLVHMGFGNGALLRWAGRRLEEFHGEIGPSLKFLLWQHAAILLPGAALVWWLLPKPSSLVGVAVLGFSLIMNTATILQLSLQGARLFRPVAIGIAAPPGLFILMAFLWYLHGIPSFRELILLYCAAWIGVLTYLWIRVRPKWQGPCGDSPWTLGKAFIAAGWPIVLADGGFGFVQSADRLAVSSVLPIREFAQYSLAASTMFVPVAAILAVSRVFFSHVAGVEHEGRARLYTHASNLVVLAWSLLLPYYFLLEVFVRHFLPNYVAALPIAAVLLLGLVFLAGIQILHMSYSYLYGRQRQFLALTVGAFATSLVVASVMALRVKSLTAVAAGQVAVLGVWWGVNEWSLRKETGQRWGEWLRVSGFFVLSAGLYSATLWARHDVAWRLVIYYLADVPVLLSLWRREFRLVWQMIGDKRLPAANGAG